MRNFNIIAGSLLIIAGIFLSSAMADGKFNSSSQSEATKYFNIGIGVARLVASN